MALFDFYGCERNRGWNWVRVKGLPTIRPAASRQFVEEQIDLVSPLLAEAHAQYLAQKWFMDVEWRDHRNQREIQYARFNEAWRDEPWPKDARGQMGAIVGERQSSA